MNIIVDISTQQMYLFKAEQIIKQYPISTSKYGIGNLKDSMRTPLGKHEICEKIGAGIPIYGIFEKRCYNGISAKQLQQADTKDLITSRILRLKGLELNINRGGDIDSETREIWIHGTNEEQLISSKASHGCIRMNNKDIIELFDLVELGTIVDIQLGEDENGIFKQISTIINI